MSKKRVIGIVVVALAVVLLAAAPVDAQTASSFKISTSIPGAMFRVDGQTYTSAAAFLWPQGSKHILEWFNGDDGYQYNSFRDVRYQFQSWSENTGILVPSGETKITVTADPAITAWTINVTVEYQVKLQVLNVDNPVQGGCAAPGDPPEEYRPGIVYVDGQCFSGTTEFWMNAGTHQLNAFAYPGYAFVGWIQNSGALQSFLSNFIVTGAMNLRAIFTAAKRITFLTEPAGLHVLVDRTVTPTVNGKCKGEETVQPDPLPSPYQLLCDGEFDFLPNSMHVIGAPSPQVDNVGRTWVFDSFSNGVAQNTAFSVGPFGTPEVIVAKFTRAIVTAFSTSPSGLKLKIDGRDNWVNYYFYWVAGSKHTAEAPLEQTDSKGRRYVFKRWNNEADPAQEIVTPDTPDTSPSFVAEYELLSQLRITANTGGASVEVNGTLCDTPCVIDRHGGTEVSLVAPESRSIGDGQRLRFGSWSDQGPRERTVMVDGTDVKTLTMNYQTDYLLAVTGDPPKALNYSSSPFSADGFYPEGTVVTLTAQTTLGYKFRRWADDLDTSSPIATITMSRPRNVRARYDEVPEIAPAGIRNAAGDTPENVVAPGSLVTIYGSHLADALEIGPASPLAQALGGISVMVNDRILPLLFVSPEQINAQLPRDLAAGEYSLKIIRVGQQPLVGKFTIAGCAPGLFNQFLDGQHYVVARHANGDPVTIQNPALQGETISVFGTGFGSYKLSYPAGFALPSAPQFDLDHKVEIQAGANTPATGWAGGAAGMVGVDTFSFTVSEEMAAAPALPLKITIDGHQSNEVLLPIGH